MSQFSSTIQLRLTAPQEGTDVWKKAQKVIAGIIGDDRTRELTESGELKQEIIEVRPVYEFDRGIKQQTGDLVGVLDLDAEKAHPLKRVIGIRDYNQIISALERVVVARISKAEIVLDPVSQKLLLRTEAPQFLNGYLRQTGELASTLAGEPVAILALTSSDLFEIDVPYDPGRPANSASAGRKIQEACDRLAQMRETKA